jgi:hypothetical protein
MGCPAPTSLALVPISPIAEIAGALISVEVDLKWARSALIDLEPVPISAANLMRKAGERLLEAAAQLSELAGVEGIGQRGDGL